MNHRIGRLSTIVTLGLLVVSIALGYWQVVRADELTARQDNPRQIRVELRSARGRILDRNGEVLAVSERTPDGYYRRRYTEPSLSPVVGLLSHQLGNTGIEAAMDSSLRGDGPMDPVTLLARGLARRSPEGDDVVLTIDLGLQRAAVAALGDREGAIVVIDLRNGEVLAMASRPFVDFNRLAFNPAAERWSVESRRVDEEWQAMRSDPSSPLINRATQGLYVPGSTYKTITLAAALERGVAQPNTSFPIKLNPPDRNHPIWWHQDHDVECTNHPENQTALDLRGAFAWSCNVIFADLAQRVGADAYLDISRQFGVGERPPIEIAAEMSRVAVDPNFLYDANGRRALAETGMGQGQLQMTPLQMALIAGVPGTDGSIYSPHLVKEIRSPNGQVIQQTERRIWKRAVSSKTASQIREMMEHGAEIGWAKSAASPLFKVGGKTGTAETGFGDRPPHSWFIGLAPMNDPAVAIAVVEPFAGGGSTVAAPVARTVLERALRR